MIDGTAIDVKSINDLSGKMDLKKELDSSKSKLENKTKNIGQKTDKELGKVIPRGADISDYQKKKYYIFYSIYWLALILIIVSIFMPWWSFSSYVEGEGVDGVAELEMGLAPDGGFIDTPVGDLTEMLGPEIAAVSMLIALPLLLPLIFTVVDGLYNGFGRIVSKRLFVTPLWVLVALLNWMAYYYTVSTGLSMVGLDIPPTGSESLEFEEYTLAGASWGWGNGMYLAIAAFAIMMLSAFMMRKYRFDNVDISKSDISYSFTLHSALFVILGVLSWIYSILLGQGSRVLGAPEAGAFFPFFSALVFFAMAALSRKSFLVCEKCREKTRLWKFYDRAECRNCGDVKTFSERVKGEGDKIKNKVEQVDENSPDLKVLKKSKKEVENMVPDKEKESIPPPPPEECSVCGEDMEYVKEYDDWYCWNCETYKSNIEEPLEEKSQTEEPKRKETDEVLDEETDSESGAQKKIRELKKMQKEGLITEEQYERKVDEILDEYY